MIALVLVCMAVAAHHGGLVIEGDGHHGAGVAIELCLGVFTAVGAAVAAAAIGTVALGRWRPPSTVSSAGLSAAAEVPSIGARAGPLILSLLCVSRR